MLALLIWHGYELSAEVKLCALPKCFGLRGHFLGTPDPLLTPETNSLMEWKSQGKSLAISNKAKHSFTAALLGNT